MPKILFVCTANRYRSPIAEACLRDTADHDRRVSQWEVSSAGTWTKDGLSPTPEAIREADRLGLDIRSHRSRVMTRQIIEEADLVLVMEQGHKEALQNEFPQKKEFVYLLSEVTVGIPFDFPDPMASPGDGRIATEICSLIKTKYGKIFDLAGKFQHSN